MKQIKKAKEEANKFIIKYPQYAPEVKDLLSLMIDEIEGGESADNELNLFLQSLDQLLE